jgi:hypothetical protein
MRRSQRLRSEQPLRLHALIDESALTRRIAKRNVLVAQLLHIVELSELENVIAQVIPVSVGIHPGLRGAFSVLSFPEDTILDLGYVDHAGGNLQLVKAPQVAELSRQFAKLAKIALDENESRELLFRLANQLSA